MLKILKSKTNATCVRVVTRIMHTIKKIKRGFPLKDRRINDSGRGTIPWDEPYERRSSPHNY